jgi:hypothetical protein
LNLAKIIITPEQFINTFFDRATLFTEKACPWSAVPFPEVVFSFSNHFTGALVNKAG